VTTGCLPSLVSGEKDGMPEERNPLDMTEEEIAEANRELLPERRAMSVSRGVEPLPQPIDIDTASNVEQEDPPGS
jgi:hypothetical protein